ncbi:MAG TPA: efflux RND transporter periplasmic adaptor subunit [Kofleriaceae bacterium]|nr:efflux RND transporter periplasmic adaptor subunit [Kofleriaceae bacterium]
MPALRPLALLLSVVVPLAACGKKGGETAEKKAPPAPVKVVAATVSEAPTPEQLVLTGMIKADQRAEVTADTQGKVLNVMVERGMRVKMGAPMLQLDVRSAALGAREAAANLASARAQRQLAEQECERTKQLLEKGAIPRAEYDRQIAQCTSALQQVSAAEARTAMMSKTVADGIVRAPFDGVVSEKSVSAGEWVAPGRPLLTLVDDDPLKIELSVPEAAVAAVKEKQRVELSAVAFPEKVYQATITRLGAEIGRTRSLIAEATLDPGSDLVPGMFAEARVTIGSAPHAVVPKTAVVRRGKQSHIFVINKGELEDRIVQVGPAPGEGQLAILQGVTKGEKVVAKVTDQIIDGLSVTE